MQSLKSIDRYVRMYVCTYVSRNPVHGDVLNDVGEGEGRRLPTGSALELSVEELTGVFRVRAPHPVHGKRVDSPLGCIDIFKD